MAFLGRNPTRFKNVPLACRVTLDRVSKFIRPIVKPSFVSRFHVYLLGKTIPQNYFFLPQYASNVGMCRDRKELIKRCNNASFASRPSSWFTSLPVCHKSCFFKKSSPTKVLSAGVCHFTIEPKWSMMTPSIRNGSKLGTKVPPLILKVSHTTSKCQSMLSCWSGKFLRQSFSTIDFASLVAYNHSQKPIVPPGIMPEKIISNGMDTERRPIATPVATPGSTARM
jgi:hypothetical protein